MKSILVITLLLATAVAFDFDCKVTCPTGYRGGCVKSAQGCDCSCQRNAADLRKDLLRALQGQGASEKIQQQATALLQSDSEVPSKTFRTGNEQFTIFVKKY